MPTEFGGVEWVAYTASGETLADLVAAIQHLPEAGSAEWHPSYDYVADDQGVVTSAEVAVSWKITLPTWDGYGAASQAAKDEWDRFAAALETHELGHLDLVERALTDLDQQMVGRPATELETFFNTTKDALQAASDAYDAQNNHGQNDGTVIDLNIT